MRTSVDRFLSDLEADKGFSANTVSAYRNDLNQFVGFLDERYRLDNWLAVADIHLQEYLQSLREREYATSTIARKTAALKSFCQHMARSGELRGDPSESLSSPRVEKYVPKAMSEDQIRALLLQPASSSAPEAQRDTAMLHMLYATGMRVSELVGLNLGDLDLERRSVRCTGKQGRVRDVPLGDDAVAALGTYLHEGREALVRGGDDPALFLNHRGHRLTRQGFWLILKDHAKAAGISDITPHTLRHSFAAHQIGRGRDLGDVQRILGHVSIATTQVYQRIATDMAASDGHGGGTNGLGESHALHDLRQPAEATTDA